MDEQKESGLNSTSRNLRSVIATTMLPRERAAKCGVEALSDAELLAILLGTGMKGKNVLDLANEILCDNEGHLAYIAKRSLKELTARYGGLGQGKALGLLAALELGNRRAKDAAEIERARKPVTSSDAAYELMKHRFNNLDHEEFWVMALNHALRYMTDFRVSTGGTTSTIVEPRAIVRRALDLNCSVLMLFHNHPSGTLKPSAQDDNLTSKIKDAAALFEIKVVDHIIITESGYFSYNDEGRL